VDTARSDWPATVDEAAERIISGMSDEDKALVRSTKRDDLLMFHHGWGTGIRNDFGLWQGNTALLESCGPIHPDGCSMVIIERVWERLQEDGL